MRCPILNDFYKPKSLSTIEYDDLSQLENIDEGYTVEYKSTLNKDVKKKLPRIIASFANSTGGWIFIGIQDDGIVCDIEKERNDFSQTIAQLVKAHVSPIPKFDTRFIQNTPQGESGVLAIEVYEGAIPPYIADGQVCIRIGSSSEGYAHADSNALIELNRKARQFHDELDAFCKRTIYYPPTSISAISGTRQYDYPIVDVYLKKTYVPKEVLISYNALDKQRDIMSKAFSDSFKCECFCQPARDTTIFRCRPINSVDTAEPAIELFRDGSIKAAIPLSKKQLGELENSINRLSHIVSIRNSQIVEVIDGHESIGRVGLAVTAVESFIEASGYSEADYAIACEFENLQGNMVEFDTPEYDDYIRTNGIPFVGTTDSRSNTTLMADYEGLNYHVSDLVIQSFVEGCGIPLTTNIEERKAWLFRLMRTNTAKNDALVNLPTNQPE